MISASLLGADELRAWLQHVPPSLRTNLRREIRTVSTPLVNKIKSNASWSTRIPGAVRVKTSFGARSSGVRIIVDRKKAPHARPLEFGNAASGRINRHPVPVFQGRGKPAGEPVVFVNQPTRPFFFPAVRAHAPAVRAAVQKAITDTLRSP